MACPSTNREVQDLFAKLLEKRFDRQSCCAGILYECVRFLTGHYKVNAAEEFLSFGCFRTEHRLVSAYINRIINVAWCFGHGILLDPEAGILCPFQPVLQGGNFGGLLFAGPRWSGTQLILRIWWDGCALPQRLSRFPAAWSALSRTSLGDRGTPSPGIGPPLYSRDLSGRRVIFFFVLRQILRCHRWIRRIV